MIGVTIVFLMVASVALTMITMAGAQFLKRLHHQEISSHICIGALITVFISYTWAFLHWHKPGVSNTPMIVVTLGTFVLLVAWYIALIQIKHHNIAKHQHLPQ